ncbi:MAG: nodulation protein NfeD [Desulfofustis sp.]|jgi:membrane-bound serine protease (ClpP class)
MHFSLVNFQSSRAPVVCLIIQFFLYLFPTTVLSVSEEKSDALLLSIDGTINPAVSDYIRKGFQLATEENASMVIIRMNTPGGLDASMRDIIQEILSSPVAVVTYVSPDGARAASAGTYILYASHVAAMAPATNLGAATPIQIGGLGSAKDKEKPDEEDAKDPRSALEKKIINDASAYIKALADKHNRNGEWAVQAVQEAVSLTAQEALELNVINIVADNLDDLLEQLDGYQLVIDGEPVSLSTSEVDLNNFEQSWRYKLLGVISDPTIAYLLLLLGFYGLIYELANPGFFLPGVAGGIALMLALYALQLLPVNYSGLALMILGIGFLVGEAFMPSFGTLGVGGIIAFAAGSLILIDDQTMRVALPTIIGTTAVSALFILLLMSRVAMMRRKRIHTGVEAMVGTFAEARSDFSGSGMVWVNGESWNAHSSVPVKKGEKVKILSISGLELIIEPTKEDS